VHPACLSAAAHRGVQEPGAYGATLIRTSSSCSSHCLHLIQGMQEAGQVSSIYRIASCQQAISRPQPMCTDIGTRAAHMSCLASMVCCCCHGSCDRRHGSWTLLLRSAMARTSLLSRWCARSSSRCMGPSSMQRWGARHNSATGITANCWYERRA
jgi:hypothetical protein